jgi:transcriptional regulator with XRE-family HTH domain
MEVRRMSAESDAREATRPHWEVGARLGRFRTDLGDDQATFARRLGVSQPTLSHWERGRRLPSAEALVFYAALDADINWLLTGVPAAPSSEAPAGDAAPPVESIELRQWDGTADGLRALADWAGNGPDDEPQFSWVTSSPDAAWSDPMLGDEGIRPGDFFAMVDGWAIPVRLPTQLHKTEPAPAGDAEAREWAIQRSVTSFRALSIVYGPPLAPLEVVKVREIGLPAASAEGEGERDGVATLSDEQGTVKVWMTDAGGRPLPVQVAREVADGSLRVLASPPVESPAPSKENDDAE